MDQRRQGCGQVDGAVVPDVRGQRRAAPTSCARLQSGQFLADAGDARDDQGLVTDKLEGEADQDRRESREPRRALWWQQTSLACFPVFRPHFTFPLHSCYIAFNAQIAAGHALTLRLGHHWYLVTSTSAYGCSKKIRHIIKKIQAYNTDFCVDLQPSRRLGRG